MAFGLHGTNGQPLGQKRIVASYRWHACKCLYVSNYGQIMSLDEKKMAIGGKKYKKGSKGKAQEANVDRHSNAMVALFGRIYVTTADIHLSNK